MDAAAFEQLLRRGQRRDPDALETLYELYGQRVYGLLYRLTRSRDEAEDLVQATFLRVVRVLPDYQHTGKFEAWLFRIATNVTIDHLRRQRRIGWVALDRLAHVLRGEDGTRRVEVADPFHRALATLSADQQSLLMLFGHLGLKAPEVAEVLGITPAATRKRRQRARAAFMSAYKKESQS